MYYHYRFFIGKIVAKSLCSGQSPRYNSYNCNHCQDRYKCTHIPLQPFINLVKLLLILLDQLRAISTSNNLVKLFHLPVKFNACATNVKLCRRTLGRCFQTDTCQRHVSLYLETFVPSYFDAAGPAVPNIPAYLPHQGWALLTVPSERDIM